MPDPKTFKQHFESKHPKSTLPPELVDVEAWAVLGVCVIVCVHVCVCVRALCVCAMCVCVSGKPPYSRLVLWPSTLEDSFDTLLLKRHLPTKHATYIILHTYVNVYLLIDLVFSQSKHVWRESGMLWIYPQVHITVVYRMMGALGFKFLDKEPFNTGIRLV